MPSSDVIATPLAMQTALPSLSVVIPNYNDARYIGKALGAIANQSVPPTEVIVVDDGSTDESVQVIEGFVQTHPTVKLLRNDRNRGGIFSANRGLAAATSEYVYFASANDIVLPGIFEESLRLLGRYPAAGLCCGDFVIYFGPGAAIEYSLGWTKTPGYLSPDALVAVMRTAGGYIPGATSIVRLSALREVGLLDTLRGHCDWFAHLVIGFRYGVCYVPRPLAIWRAQQPGSYSARSRLWSTQREVVGNLIALLESPAYRDVLPMFQQSAALFFPPHVLRVLLSRRGYWQHLSPVLLKRALWTGVRRSVIQRTPLVVKQMLSALQRRRRGAAAGARAELTP